jgi:hypothetical protein
MSPLLRRQKTGTSHLVARDFELTNRRACWNCGSLHHELIDCPHKRDQAQINLSRAIFTTQKDQMPEYALPYLQMYTFDAEERERRLSLVDRFRPDHVSRALFDAVFYTDEESTREEEEQIDGWRRRGYYPWYQWMMKWGYPPGWIAGRGEPIGHKHS